MHLSRCDVINLTFKVSFTQSLDYGLLYNIVLQHLSDITVCDP